MNLDLQAKLTQAIEAAGIPGASVAVWHGEEESLAAAGVLNRATGVEATPDSVFQAGSITKVLTATLLLQLREQGRLDLGDTLGKHLPRMAGTPLEQIPLLCLLSHRGGIPCDIEDDTGNGADCISRFVDLLARREVLYPPGLLAAYSNAGYVLLGAVCEQVTGRSWDDLLRDNILIPAGMSHSFTQPIEIPRFRAAMGHYCDAATRQATLVPNVGLPRSGGPGGMTLWASAPDLIRVARALIDGTPELLSRPAFAEMLTPQPEAIKLPYSPTYGYAWALGEIDGLKVASHAGATIGQNSLLWTVPEKRFAVALLTNSGNGIALLGGLLQDIVTACLGVSLPRAQLPSVSPTPILASALDPQRYVGDYGGGTALFHVRANGNELSVDYERLARPDSPQTSGRVLLTPVDGQVFLSRPADAPGPSLPLQFVTLPGAARPNVLYALGRAYRRL
ncbi:MAG: serine hydrolase domain-containing protein [Sterolibacterium sp.]|jgi:CubicO group peptidase (beta-lactamase class C family)